MPAKRSALAALDAAIADSPRYAPKRSWFSRLPKEAQQDFAELKKRFVAGEYAGVRIVVIHRAVVARCKEESWPAPADAQTVHRWLLR